MFIVDKQKYEYGTKLYFSLSSCNILIFLKHTCQAQALFEIKNIQLQTLVKCKYRLKSYDCKLKSSFKSHVHCENSLVIICYRQLQITTATKQARCSALSALILIPQLCQPAVYRGIFLPAVALKLVV